MKIFAASVLILSLSSVLAETLEYSHKQQPFRPLNDAKSIQSLSGFPYRIGDRFGISKANTLLNFINSASLLYRDDVKQNLEYIHSSMMAAFGSETNLFGLMIQVNSTNDLTDTFIYNTGDSASFSAGICMINPTWSYYAYFYPNQGQSMEMISSIGQGKGINSTMADIINQFIADTDGKLNCHCQSSYVNSKIEWDHHYGWDVLCSGKLTNFAYVPVKDSQWMVTKPSHCYYLVYVT